MSKKVTSQKSSAGAIANAVANVLENEKKPKMKPKGNKPKKQANPGQRVAQAVTMAMMSNESRSALCVVDPTRAALEGALAPYPREGNGAVNVFRTRTVVEAPGIVDSGTAQTSQIHFLVTPNPSAHLIVSAAHSATGVVTSTITVPCENYSLFATQYEDVALVGLSLRVKYLSRTDGMNGSGTMGQVQQVGAAFANWAGLTNEQREQLPSYTAPALKTHFWRSPYLSDSPEADHIFYVPGTGAGTDLGGLFFDSFQTALDPALVQIEIVAIWAAHVLYSHADFLPSKEYVMHVPAVRGQILAALALVPAWSQGAVMFKDDGLLGSLSDIIRGGKGAWGAGKTLFGGGTSISGRIGAIGDLASSIGSVWSGFSSLFSDEEMALRTLSSLTQKQLDALAPLFGGKAPSLQLIRDRIVRLHHVRKSGFKRPTLACYAGSEPDPSYEMPSISRDYTASGAASNAGDRYR